MLDKRVVKRLRRRQCLFSLLRLVKLLLQRSAQAPLVQVQPQNVEDRRDADERDRQHRRHQPAIFNGDIPQRHARPRRGCCSKRKQHKRKKAEAKMEIAPVLLPFCLLPFAFCISHDSAGGSLIVKVVPFPGLLWARIVPPCKSTNAFTTLSPSPSPRRQNSYC